MFDKALAVILHHEGGYVNHPRDPGGITNLGVTKNTWESWVKRAVTVPEMRALTPKHVAPLYKARYWDALRCDEIPAGLALCMFDFGVNAGPARAARYAQMMVGAGQDGKIGPRSIEAIKAFVAQHGEAEAVRQYQEARRGYYRRLPTFSTFGRGWLRRVDEVETEALKLTRRA
jgi:lysozyme family protein